MSEILEFIQPTSEADMLITEDTAAYLIGVVVDGQPFNLEGVTTVMLNTGDLLDLGSHEGRLVVPVSIVDQELEVSVVVSEDDTYTASLRVAQLISEPEVGDTGDTLEPEAPLFEAGPNGAPANEGEQDTQPAAFSLFELNLEGEVTVDGALIQGDIEPSQLQASVNEALLYRQSVEVLFDGSPVACVYRELRGTQYLITVVGSEAPNEVSALEGRLLVGQVRK